MSGGLAAGAKAAFVARPGQTLDPHALLPDVGGATLTEVTEAIARADG